MKRKNQNQNLQYTNYKRHTKIKRFDLRLLRKMILESRILITIAINGGYLIYKINLRNMMRKIM